MPYHPVTNTIQNMLKQHNFWFETFEHEPVKTSTEAAATRPGYTLHQGAKALIVRAYTSKSEYRLLMLVLPADLKFNSKTTRTKLNFKDIKFASESEVEEITKGVKIGGVPPFGNLFGLEVFCDPKLLENEKIVFNAGGRSFSIGMKSADYQTLTNPQMLELT